MVSDVARAYFNAPNLTPVFVEICDEDREVGDEDMCGELVVSVYVRGVSWSELATVPKRKSRRSLDMNFLWNAEEGVWKVWKKSNGTERKKRRVKRTTTTQRTDDHAWME